MRVQIDGISLNYELAGSGRCLALIHGLGDDLTLWANQIPAFAKHYRVLRYDVRGFGESDKPEEEYSAEIFSEDLYLLLKALKIDEAFVLGYSMGGVIAQRFALDYPEITKALIIVSSASECNQQAIERYETTAHIAEKHGMEVLEREMEGYFTKRRFFPGFAERNPDSVAKFRKHWLGNDPKGYARAARAMAKCALTSQLGNIRCPTLIIVGDKDISAGVGGSVIMSRHIPGSQLKMLKDCGHDPMTEQPELFNATVMEFLATV